jgi:hypothetical protein
MKKLSLIVAKHIFVHPDMIGFQGYEDAGKELDQEFDKRFTRFKEELIRKLNKNGAITESDIKNL